MQNFYYLKEINISNLWGNRDFQIRLYKDVNIIIGRNASGKTTILDLLRFILTLDLLSLSQIEFDEVVLRLGRVCKVRTQH